MALRQEREGSMSKEAMKLALDALEWCHGGEPCGTAEAITALREALANEALDKMAKNARELGLDYEQEPVAYLCEPDENGLYGLPLTEKTCTKCFPVYRHPQRTWVGLTGAEITTSIPYSVTRDKGCFHAGALWADDKLKGKNT